MDDGRDQKKDTPEERIVRLMRDSAPKANTASKPRRTKAVNTDSVSISGNGNVVGSGNVVVGGDINVHAGPAPRPKVIVKTGDGVIDAKQKADLAAKLKQWLSARNAVRRDKMPMAGAWSAFNAAMKVNSYSELRPDQLPMAFAWIAKQRAIVASMKSAPVRIPGFRSEAIGAIKARAKQLGDSHYYTPHIVKTYGLSSLAHLSDRQLQEVRAWIMAKRR